MTGADEPPADDARADAAPTTAEQRADAALTYRNKVDHTYHVARIEAGDSAQAEARQPPGGATARDETPEPDADQDQDASPRRVAEEDKEGTAPDDDAETPSAGARDGDTQSRSAGARDGDTQSRSAGARDGDTQSRSAGARDGHTQTRSPGAADQAGPEAGDYGAGGPDAEDTRARDAWAAAVTELRAEWEKHEQLFPERSRSAPDCPADGGWLADGDRRLTPEQNTDASKACEDIRAEGREVILPAMERVEAADPDRRLAGLEHMLKGEDRLKEKIADELR